MSGSSPDADVVTRSTGIGLSPFAARSASTCGGDPLDQLLVRRPEVRPGRRVAVVAGGFSSVTPAAEGRLQKYFGLV